jgi:hypothetical protein
MYRPELTASAILASKLGSLLLCLFFNERFPGGGSSSTMVYMLIINIIGVNRLLPVAKDIRGENLCD